MIDSSIKSIYLQQNKERFCQGDILENVNISYGLNTKQGEYTFPYTVILSQDCDLMLDHKSYFLKESCEHNNDDKMLENILVCPAFIREPFTKGEHIPNKTMQLITSKMKNDIQKNNNKRYHFFKAENNVPEMVVDFKFFVTVPRDTLYSIYDEIYLTSLNEVFREQLSQNFTNYLSRIGLPEI